MHKERFKLIPTAHLFLIRDNKILLARRRNTGYEDGNYSVPAGHIDGGEPATHAMSREAREEAGIIIPPNDFKLAHVMHKRQLDERIDFFFTAERWEGEPRNMEPHKCDHMDWFLIDKMPENTIPYIRRAVEHYLNGQRFSEFGW